MEQGLKQERIAKIARRTLHGEVAARLRDLIVEGYFAPGQRINEVRLGEDLGVSRTPLREAIRTLTSEGLLELLPNHGTKVRTFAPAEVIAMIEAAGALEEGCVDLLCSRANHRDIRKFVEVTGKMEHAYVARERLKYFAFNQDLHSMLVRISGNDMLARMHGELQSTLKRVRFLGNDEPAVWAQAVEQHGRMASALAARDRHSLLEVLRAHRELTVNRIRNIATVEKV